MAAIRDTDFNLGESGQPADRLRGMLRHGGLLPAARAHRRPSAARSRRTKIEPGSNGVVVLSHGTWVQRFAARSRRGRPHAPDRWRARDDSRRDAGSVSTTAQLWGEVDAWRPLALPDVTRADRENTYLRVIARSEAGRRRSAQAQAAMGALSARLATAYPATNTQPRRAPGFARRQPQDDTGRGITWLVAGLAGFVLLIACANLANLQFARNAARGREHAIRAALGASRAQLMRLVLTESVLLSLVGGALGLVLALWTNDLVGRTFTFGERAGLDIAARRARARVHFRRLARRRCRLRPAARLARVARPTSATRSSKAAAARRPAARNTACATR